MSPVNTLPIRYAAQALYAPNRSEVLVGPGRGINNQLFEELKLKGSRVSVVFSRIRDLYPTYQFANLVQHRAIVLFPYQVRVGRKDCALSLIGLPCIWDCHCFPVRYHGHPLSNKYKGKQTRGRPTEANNRGRGGHTVVLTAATRALQEACKRALQYASPWFCRA